MEAVIAILVCGRDAREYALIEKDCKRQAALSGNEDLLLEQIADDQALSEVRADEKLVDLLYYTFRKGQSISELLSFRKRYGSTMVMLIADKAVSPLEYLRPGISPDSLLLRPLEESQLQEINAEFMGSFFERFCQKQAESCFVVDTREERVFVPFSHIYYFEARDKKLFVRTKNEEYAFYDTIEALRNRLPENFRRCHRSYIVNVSKIVRIRTAENFIELNDRLGVPVSRSYKAAFRGVVQG